MFGRKKSHNKPEHTAAYNNPTAATLKELVSYSRHDTVLPLKADRARSLQSGTFLSPFKGRGMEFVEARPYQQGDDIRHLDWRVTARIGKPHSKVFQEERERTMLLWVDLHYPMHFATKGAFKSVVASHAAALTAWNGARSGDRIGGVIASEDSHVEIRPHRGKKGVLNFLQQLAQHPSWKTNGSKTEVDQDKFLRLRRVIRPGSLVFLFSDMRSLGSREEKHISQIARHSDLVLCHIYDHFEKQLPPKGSYNITDGQKLATLFTGHLKVRSQHEKLWLLKNEYLQGLCKKQGLHLIQLATNDNIVQAMRNGLMGGIAA